LIETRTAPDLSVQTDVGLLGQVIGNLLDNALKYSREAADHRLWLRCRHEEGRLIFEVEDRGPGVQACERERIFAPFKRGNGCASVTGGVGLGLALARRWTRMLGGQLTLVCPDEGGACFRVELTAP